MFEGAPNKEDRMPLEQLIQNLVLKSRLPKSMSRRRASGRTCLQGVDPPFQSSPGFADVSQHVSPGASLCRSAAKKLAPARRGRSRQGRLQHQASRGRLATQEKEKANGTTSGSLTSQWIAPKKPPTCVFATKILRFPQESDQVQTRNPR